MRIRTLCSGVLAVSLSGVCAADGLPNTMNFENVTSTRLNQITSTSGSNIMKDVDFGDFDNDGDLDVAIAVSDGIFGSVQNVLYRNDGGVLNEVSGVGTTIIPGFNTADLTRYVFFRDFDNDGWLDMLIANDDLSGGGPYKYYRNHHPGGVFDSFVEEGAARGLGDEATCGAWAGDFDNDGDVDIYAGNYPGPSQDTMHRNDGTGNFTNITGTHVPIDSDYTIDVAAGDLNGDGKVDLLISNEFDPFYIYYNDLNGSSDHGVGDYRYAGSTVNLGNSADGAMECGDFNGDGLLDYYRSNFTGATGDRIFINTGNDGSGKATFSQVTPPLYVTSTTTNKITVADMNDDGRVDMLVAAPGGRPAVLRNTTVNNDTSFVDWTPYPAFPVSLDVRAHMGNVFDSNGDGDQDIFLGTRDDDMLFEQVASNELTEDGLGGALPSFFNQDPLAISGFGPSGDVDEYTFSGLSNNAVLSVVLNGEGDYLLELLNDDTETVISTSDRGGLNVEEALQYQTSSNPNFKLRVTILDGDDTVGDVNGSGVVNFDDIIAVINAFGACRACPEDITPPGGNGFVNIDDLLETLNDFGSKSGEYVLEVLSRSG